VYNCKYPTCKRQGNDDYDDDDGGVGGDNTRNVSQFPFFFSLSEITFEDSIPSTGLSVTDPFEDIFCLHF
jgi:hypothetical protein